MGVFEQLADLDKTKPVASPVPPETPVPAPDAPSQPDDRLSVAGSPTRSSRRRPKTDWRVPLDSARQNQRIISRASFEIYQDQLQVLRQVSLSAKLAGDNLSISEMVREALDSYLTDKNLKP